MTLYRAARMPGLSLDGYLQAEKAVAEHGPDGLANPALPQVHPAVLHTEGDDRRMTLLPAERLSPWPREPQDVITVTPSVAVATTSEDDGSTPQWAWALAVLRRDLDPALPEDPLALWAALTRWLAKPRHGGWRATINPCTTPGCTTTSSRLTRSLTPSSTAAV